MKAIALLLVPSLGFADSSPALLAEVEGAYAKAKHLQASFKQTNVIAAYGKKKATTGRVRLVRPDKMRWDYDDPNKKGKSFIFDGKTLWVVEPKNLQVFQHTTLDPSLPAALAFLNGSSALTKEFDVTSPRADTLELVPKQTNAKVKKVTFVVDAKTKQVVKSTVENHNQDTATYELSNVDLTKPPDANVFEFSPRRKPTYKVIHVKADEPKQR